MRALLLTAGSQGDVQPFLALATELRVRGHEPLLVAPAMFAGLAARHDVPFAPLHDYDIDAAGSAMTDTRGPRRLVRMASVMGRQARGCLPRLVVDAAGSDVVIHHPIIPLGGHVAEYLDVPAVAATPSPVFVPTREFPSPAWAVNPPAVLARSSYAAVRALLGAPLHRDVDRWRAAVGLPRRRHRRNPLRDPDGRPATVLHAVSPAVLPRPADWPSTSHLTGFWFLPAAPTWSPPARLARFLAAGPPPVGVGFGSIAMADPRGLVEQIREAARSLGVRLLLIRGYHGLGGVRGDEHVHVTPGAPHDWLFPRLAAVVHHGGAGTTAAAVAAGVPQVICPMGTDQPFWAARMRALGVAPPAPALPDLTAGPLATALRTALTDDLLRRRTAELATLVNAEAGLTRAVDLIEHTVTNRAQPARRARRATPPRPPRKPR